MTSDQTSGAIDHPAVRMLADRIESCRAGFSNRQSSPMRLVVSEGDAQPYVVMTVTTVRDWLDCRSAELAWIERSFIDAAYTDTVPTSTLRPVSRDDALAQHINKPRVEGTIWPLHFAAGLFHHILQHVELLAWPDLGWGGYADYEHAAPGQAEPE